MDTFTHILIAFLLIGKFDVRLGLFAGFMALFLDLDFVLAPLTKKYPSLEHRGIVHSFPIIFILTLITSLIYTLITWQNYFLVLLAGLAGSFTHIIGDSITNYGTNSLWPFAKRYVKLNIIPGIDFLQAGISLTTIPLLFVSYLSNNFQLFNLIYLIVGVFLILYFSIRTVMKVIVYFKFKTTTLPMLFNWFKFKIVYEKNFKQGDKEYMEYKWIKYNVITRSNSKGSTFKFSTTKPALPLDTDEKRISYTYNLDALQDHLKNTEYNICEILKHKNDETVLFWYSLELKSGSFRMGAKIFLKNDGTYRIKNARVYK